MTPQPDTTPDPLAAFAERGPAAQPHKATPQSTPCAEELALLAERWRVRAHDLSVALQELNFRVHRNYDFNADPDSMTLVVGKLLNAEDLPAPCEGWQNMEAELRRLAAVESRVKEMFTSPAILRANILRHGPAGYDIYDRENETVVIKSAPAADATAGGDIVGLAEAICGDYERSHHRDCIHLSAEKIAAHTARAVERATKELADKLEATRQKDVAFYTHAIDNLRARTEQAKADLAAMTEARDFYCQKFKQKCQEWSDTDYKLADQTAISEKLLNLAQEVLNHLHTVQDISRCRSFASEIITADTQEAEKE